MFNWLDYLLPCTCLLCRDIDPTRSNLCLPCRSALPTIDHGCARCGTPTLTRQTYCGACIQKSPPFNRLISLYRYENPLPHWLTQWKFHQQLMFARTLSELMWQRMESHYVGDFPDAILAMPLHTHRLRQRGFNQAQQLAKVIGKKSHRPLLTSVERQRDTQAQSTMDALERAKNVKNAFRTTQPLPNSLLVIDDVITTGNTIFELCKTLRRAGVKRIDVWTCARALKH